MERGRPVGSRIRDNIIEIMYFMKEGYGYEIHKVYSAIFGRVAQKSIYYNLNRGLDSEEFTLVESRKEIGDFSWGNSVQKNIYSLGPNANPRISQRVKRYFDERKPQK